MAANKRTQIQIERDRRQIADWYLQGWKQAEIAEKINADEGRDYKLTQQMISYDIGQLVKQWRESGLVDIDDAKAQEIAKINHLELEYWQAWRRSCEDAEATVKKTKGVVQRRQEGDGTFVAERPAEVQQTSKGQAGDPRFLAGVQWCIDRRCKILGIDAPQRLSHEGTGEDGAIIVEQRYTDAERIRGLGALFDAVRTGVLAGDYGGDDALDADERSAMAGVSESGG